MSYELLSQVNESADEIRDYERMVNETIDYLEFDRKEVVCTEAEYEKFLRRVDHRKLMEADFGDERASTARAGEQQWMQDLAQKHQARQSQGAEYGQRKLGLGGQQGQQQQGVTPQKGQRIVLPGQGGIGYVVATDPQSGKVMIRDKAGREFIVQHNELVGPKTVGQSATWMLKR